MKGRVLEFSVQTNSGTISGDDGVRYTFAGSEWKESAPPARGQYVDFEVREGTSEVGGVYKAPGAVSADNSKQKLVAGLLALLIGGLGVHKFYLGYTSQGMILLLGTIASLVLTFVVIGLFMLVAIGVVVIVEGVIYLTKSDEDFEQTYVIGRKPWF